MVWYARANHNKRTKRYTQQKENERMNVSFVFKGNFMVIGFESCARRRLPPEKTIQHMVDCAADSGTRSRVGR